MLHRRPQGGGIFYLEIETVDLVTKQIPPAYKQIETKLWMYIYKYIDIYRYIYIYTNLLLYIYTHYYAVMYYLTYCSYITLSLCLPFLFINLSVRWTDSLKVELRDLGLWRRCFRRLDKKSGPFVVECPELGVYLPQEIHEKYLKFSKMMSNATFFTLQLVHTRWQLDWHYIYHIAAKSLDQACPIWTNWNRKEKVLGFYSHCSYHYFSIWLSI